MALVPGQASGRRARRGAVAGLLVPALVGVVLVGCEATTGSEPAAPTGGAEEATAVELRLDAELTQDSRDSAASRVAVVVANGAGEPITPTALEYADPRLSAPLVGGRLREIPPSSERRFPLPLVDPVCGGPDDRPALLTVRVGSAEQRVTVRDDVGVIDRWVQRRCAELEVAAVAPLEFTDVRVQLDAATADLVLTATPTGEGSSAYVIESVAGTPVFTSVGEPWQPQVTVGATGEPVEVTLPARPTRCDGHVFGESAGATAFLVAVTIDGEAREVLVRMDPGLSAEALDFAVAACRP